MFVREHIPVNSRLINHESIHTAQMRELLFVPFYIIYLIEWMIRLCQTGNLRDAYFAISFEKEAYRNDLNLDYLPRRKWFAQWR